MAAAWTLKFRGSRIKPCIGIIGAFDSDDVAHRECIYLRPPRDGAKSKLSTIWYEFIQKRNKRKTNFKTKANSYNSRYRERVRKCREGKINKTEKTMFYVRFSMAKPYFRYIFTSFARIFSL